MQGTDDRLDEHLRSVEAARASLNPMEKARRHFHLSQAKLAELVDVSHQTILHAEAGRTSKPTAERICEVLGRCGLLPEHILFPERYKDWEPREE